MADTHSSTHQENDSDNTIDGKYLTFVLGQEMYGLEIRYVTEIIGIQKITPVPDCPNYIKGVINLRGKVIPVMDVRLRFGMADRPYDERTCIIVIQAQNSTVGMVVDTVNEVLEISEQQIESAQVFSKGKDMPFLKGMGKVGDSVKILIDPEMMVFEGLNVQ